MLNLEEKTTISILDENKEEKSLTADEKYYYIVLTIEIVRLEVDMQSEDEALYKLGMTLKHHTGSAVVGNYQPVEDYSWLGEVISVGTTRDFDVAFLVARDHGVTKKPLFFEFDILITAEDVDVQLNTKKAM